MERYGTVRDLKKALEPMLEDAIVELSVYSYEGCANAFWHGKIVGENDTIVTIEANDRGL